MRTDVGRTSNEPGNDAGTFGHVWARFGQKAGGAEGER